MTERELEAQMIKVSKWQLDLIEIMGDDFSVEMMCSLMSTVMLDLARVYPENKDKFAHILAVTRILVLGGGQVEVDNLNKTNTGAVCSIKTGTVH